MLKKLIFLILTVTALTCTPSIFAGNRSIHPSVSSGNLPSQAEIDAMVDADSKQHPLKIPDGGLSELSDKQSDKMLHDAVNFIGDHFFVSSSDTCLDGDGDWSKEPLSDAITNTMSITGKWPKIMNGIKIESGIIYGQAMCSAFLVRNAQQYVVAVGSVSVGVQGNRRIKPIINTIPNHIKIYYKSAKDLDISLPQINAYARFYINSFDDPSMPASNPPTTFVETLYDLGHCLAGTTSKHIDVETCPKETKTLSVK